MIGACMSMRRSRRRPGDRRQKTVAMMQEAARAFEAGIRAHPQDWHMLQRVFVADLDPG